MQKGVVLLLINIESNSTVETKVAFNGTQNYRLNHHHHHQRHHRLGSRKSKVIQLPRNYRKGITREEYHLTAKDGNLHSQIVLLNGEDLTVNTSGEIPALEPIHVNATDPVTVAPLSIVFVHMPSTILHACN